MDNTNAHIRALHGDVFVCLKELQDLNRIPITDELAGHVAQVVNLYRSNTFISIEYAESLLSNVGKLIEAGQNTLVFSKCREFVAEMIFIVSDFSKTFCHKETVTSSFSSHFCYELALYILLGLIEKSELMKQFLYMVDDILLENLIEGISSVLGSDLLYLTQELGLEIIARICYSITNERSSAVRRMLHCFSSDIVQILCGSKSQIVGLLRDMRPLLTTINHSNNNLFSAWIVELSWKHNNTQQSCTLNSWVDFCAEYICFQVKNLESFIRFSYKSVGCICYLEDLSLQLIVKSVPSKVLELFQTASSEQTQSESALIFRFSSEESYSDCRNFLSRRMSDLEIPCEPTENNSKLSVVSSKLLPSYHGGQLNSEELAQTTDAQETISTLSSPPLNDKEEVKIPNIHLTRGLKQLSKTVVDSLAEVNPTFSLLPPLKKKRGRPRKRNNSNYSTAFQNIFNSPQGGNIAGEPEMFSITKDPDVIRETEPKHDGGLSRLMKIRTEAVFDKENVNNMEELCATEMHALKVKRPLEVLQELDGKKPKFDEHPAVQLIRGSKLHESLLSNESDSEDLENHSPIISNEEDDEIISTLMAEIVSMQKQRSLRKCKRLLSSHIQTAELQLTNFINQWFNFAHYLCNDFDHNNSLRMNMVQSTFKSIFSIFDDVLVAMHSIDKYLSTSAQQTLCEISTFTAESKNYFDQKAKECSVVKKEILKLKRLLTSRCRQSLHQRTDTNRNCLQQQELMKVIEKL